MTTEKPMAELRITVTPNGGHRYELFVADKRLWLTHAPATVVGRAGARARMDRWLDEHPHEVKRVGTKPPVQAGSCDEQEIAFWRTFEDRLSWELWTNVEQLFSRKVRKPDTIAGWAKMFDAVEAALRAETAVA